MSDLEEYILRRKKNDKEFAKDYNEGLENFRMFQPDLEEFVDKFQSQTESDIHHRYTSFDYCYNYFSSTQDLSKDVEKSCIVLGFYLASWGMLRGSSFLLQKSGKHYQDTIEYIAELPRSVWEIDVDNYTESNIQQILKIYHGVREKLVTDRRTHKTLVTKVLLGVFGFVPAFDDYFTETFREISDKDCRFRSVNPTSLGVIRNFYEANRTVIDKLSEQTFTTDFLSGQKTTTNYTKAKIVDMYGFQRAVNRRAGADVR